MEQLTRRRMSAESNLSRDNRYINLLRATGIVIGLFILFDFFTPAFSLPQVSQANSGEFYARKVRLVWKAIPDAVGYQLIITNTVESVDGRTDFENTLVYGEIFNPGVELDVSLLNEPESAWWQVRALNSERKPISRFSEPKKLTEGEVDPLSPFITTELSRLARTPLYPSYSWIPVLGAAGYEVQTFYTPALANDNRELGDFKKSYIIKGAASFDCYDVDDFTEEGSYSWRVIALDDKGRPMGEWSEAQSFDVLHTDNLVAALGDSVTHGGGAISNPPSDPAYDWTSYVGLPVKNLGRSGDTTDALVARFDHDVLPFQPKVLLIMGGINDIRAGASAFAVIDNLTQIEEKCRENNITPIFLTLTPINPVYIKLAFNEETSPAWQAEWRKVNEWVKQQAHYVDISPMLMNSEGNMTDILAADGLHPDTGGKAIIGRAVGEYIRKNLPDPICLVSEPSKQ
ncbi:SGNH/GDSL hydrolase family protein [Sporomusa aerivorans]|uniref:SGNH/GDSL hydrolase family protein n=1 Tax=Sporomusa aerivorans TaxID=204936 RepID=UPI00352ABF3E